MYLRTWEAGLAMGLTGAEAGWVLEDNHRVRGPLEKLGAKVYRTDPRGVRGLALRKGVHVAEEAKEAERTSVPDPHFRVVADARRAR